MNETPLVSVLIPTYNQNLEYLKACIDSALNQTYLNIEVIISDNLSSNGTDMFLALYQDERLKIIKPTKFLSMNENFAFCAQAAQGSFLSFISSDDILLPDAVEILINSLKKNEDKIVFVAGNIYHCWDLPVHNKEKWLLRKDLSKTRIFRDRVDIYNFFFPWKLSSSWMPGHLIKRDAYFQTGGFSRCDLLTSGDVWLAGELMKLGHFMLLDKPLALFRMRKLGQVEVDYDRRLFDFTDVVILKSRNKEYKYNFFRKIREYLILTYRLGWTPAPSKDAIKYSRDKFVNLNRYDLALIVAIHNKNQGLMRVLSSALHAINKIKIATRHFTIKIKNNL